MKKIVSLSAAALMTVGLMGCGADDNNFDTQNDGEIRMLERGYDDRGVNRDDDLDVNEGPLTEMMDDDIDRDILDNDNRFDTRTRDRYETNTRYRPNRDNFDNRNGTPGPTGMEPGMRNGTEGSR